MKNCRSIEKKITAYLHGELNDRDVQAMESHLASCEACRSILETQRTTLELLGATLEAAPAPEQLSPWKKPGIRPRSLMERIWFSTQLKAVLSTAVVFSLLFVFSGMFVVFTVVKKKEARFEPPPPLERPEVKLKKLQVPVNAQKDAAPQKPKLRRSIAAQDDFLGDTSKSAIPMSEVAVTWTEKDGLARAGASRHGVHVEPASAAEFSAPATVARPKMKLRKPKVKVQKTAKPKSTPRIVTKSKSANKPDIQLPEMEGLGSGLSGAVAGYEMAHGAQRWSDSKKTTSDFLSMPADDSVTEGKPAEPSSTRPQLAKSLDYYGDVTAEPAPVPAAQPVNGWERERYDHATAGVAKGTPAAMDGRGEGLAGDTVALEPKPDLEQVILFGSVLSENGEQDAVDSLGVDEYAFMDQKAARSAGESKSAEIAGGVTGAEAEKEALLLFGVADTDKPMRDQPLEQETGLRGLPARITDESDAVRTVAGKLVFDGEDKPDAGVEVELFGEVLADSDGLVMMDDVALQEQDQGALGDEGDRSEWRMRKLEPAVFNTYILAAEKAFSTFSIDVDTASYGLARQRLLSGGMPEPEQVRTEEFINSFDYDYRPPAGKQTFAVHSEMAPSPFRLGMDALKIGIKGRRIGRDDHRGAVLTLVVDTSGSMSTPERLGLVKKSLALLIDQLNPEDRVAIVQFGSEARLVLEHTPASEKTALLDAINALQPGGPTQFDKGLELGYQLAAAGYRAGDSNRIMILSDGVANLGELDPEAILQQVAEQRQQGIYLSVLGFGAGTYDDDLLERLANKGDGMYAYIDTLNEARHLLVDQLAATLHVIASDVKIQVEFNPARVLRYRQLGYENRQLTKEQFRDDTVDAGEVGSGQSVTALYDVELKPEGPADEPIATVYVRYRRADNNAIEEISSRVTDLVRVQRFEDADTRFQLAVCIAEFAERLRRSPYTEGTEIGDITARLQPVALELALDGQVKELRRLILITESLEQ